MRTQPAILAALAALFIAPRPVHAQLRGAGGSQTSYGILIGSNLSSISEADRGVRDVVGAAFDTKRRVGLNAGVFINFPLAGAFSFQPEAHYSQKGVTYESTVGASAAKATFKLDYVEVPLLLRVDIGHKASSIHPILFGGASGAFRITCRADFTSNGSSTTRQCSETTTSTTTDPVKKYDLSAIGGAGLSVSGMGRSYALTIRYVQGLSNISTQPTGSNSLKNSVISIQLGIGQ